MGYDLPSYGILSLYQNNLFGINIYRVGGNIPSVPDALVIHPKNHFFKTKFSLGVPKSRSLSEHKPGYYG